MRLARSAASFIAAALLAVPAAAPGLAQSTSFSDQMEDVRNAVGLGRERAPMDFTQRAPLVVPPSYNLPPPGGGDPERLGVNDPDVAARRRALTDPRRPVPPSDPGAAASGTLARSYLIDPPSGLRDPRAVASDISHDSGGPVTLSHGKATRHRHAKGGDRAATAD